MSFRKKRSKRSITTCSPGLNSTSLNGPLPTGFPLRGCTLGSVPSPKMCFGMIGVSEVLIASSSAGCGSARRTTAVFASLMVTALTGAYMLLKGWWSRMVSIENFRSSDVIGFPSWNTASLRSVSDTLRLSLDSSHFSAR